MLDIKRKPVHIAKGVSATAIRNTLNIKAKDVEIAKKVIAMRQQTNKGI
jgi:hypothetical protein